MIQKLNAISPQDFPQIPPPRKGCHVFQAKQDARHKQMVICPEQDCEWLAYMSDLDTCMVEALGVQDHPLWQARVQAFKDWQKKTNKGSKTSKDAWTWEGSSSDKWSTTSTRGSSKRGQSVPVDLSKRTNPEEKGLEWQDLESIQASTSSSRRPRFHVQLTSLFNCHQRSRNCISIGFADQLVYAEMTKIHGSIAHTVT